MRPLFRFGGVLVALVTSAAMWGAMPAGADDTQVVHAGQSIQAAVDRALTERGVPESPMPLKEAS